eukprot:1872091-Prymnesium_polylepis.1
MSTAAAQTQPAHSLHPPRREQVPPGRPCSRGTTAPSGSSPTAASRRGCSSRAKGRRRGATDETARAARRARRLARRFAPCPARRRRRA